MATTDPVWKRAEQLVSDTLLGLVPEDYVVLNDVKFKYGNIDHLVIRPDGCIFLIETKSHRGKVTTDGKRILVNGKPLGRNPVSQVMRSIRWIKALVKRLSVKGLWVVSLVAFPNARVAFRGSIGRVNVVNLRDLLGVIRQYPGRNNTFQ